MRKQKYNISQFMCPECGGIIPLPRVRRNREKGHVKDLYCPWCKRVTKTIEYKTNQPIKNSLGELIEDTN